MNSPSRPAFSVSTNRTTLAQRRARLDEQRRQRVLYHLGDSSNSNSNNNNNNKSPTNTSYNYDNEPSESESTHDPLHIMATGLDPSDAKASATSMSRKFFLTPPERWQVDQSVNLMDVETGRYDTEDNRRKSNNSGLFSGLLMASYSHPTSSPQNSNSQFLFFSSSLPSRPNKNNEIDSFLDEELGFSEDGSSSSGRKQPKKRKKKKPLKVDFPKGYDPNLWEQRAMDAKSQPMLPEEIDVDSAGDTVTHGNTSSQKSHHQLEEDHRRRRSSSGRKKKRWTRRLSSARRPRRLRPDRVALVIAGLFVVLLIVLIPLVATGKILWNKWHPKPKPSSLPPPTIPKHSLLDISSLPSSTQRLIQQAGTPQERALRALRDRDPKTTVVAWTNSTLQKDHPLDGLSALQRFVLVTLHYSTTNPAWDEPPIHWMDWTLDECDWFGNDNIDYSVCNRYHQLHTIALPRRNLTGRLPVDEMTLLANLKNLDVSDNHLTGILPGSWFRGWKNLDSLQLGNNHFQGQLPSELGLLTNSNGLYELNFNSNDFSGTLPTELGRLMNHLNILDVANNRLTGSIPPELVGGGGSYKALEGLRLNGNDLTGRIPSELGSLTLLTELQLHDNSELIPQDLPREVCDLPLLQVLTVDCAIVTCPSDCACTCQPTVTPTTVQNDIFEQMHDTQAKIASNLAKLSEDLLPTGGPTVLSPPEKKNGIFNRMHETQAKIASNLTKLENDLPTSPPIPPHGSGIFAQMHDTQAKIDDELAKLANHLPKSEANEGVDPKIHGTPKDNITGDLTPSPSEGDFMHSETNIMGRPHSGNRRFLRPFKDDSF